MTKPTTKERKEKTRVGFISGLPGLWFTKDREYRFIYGTNDKKLMNKFMKLVKKRGDFL